MLISSLVLGLILGFFYGIVSNNIPNLAEQLGAYYSSDSMISFSQMINPSLGSFSFVSLLRFWSIIALWVIGFLKNKALAIPIFILRGLSIGFLIQVIGIGVLPQSIIFIFTYFFITSKYKSEKQEYCMALLLSLGSIVFLNVFEAFF